MPPDECEVVSHAEPGAGPIKSAYGRLAGCSRGNGVEPRAVATDEPFSGQSKVFVLSKEPVQKEEE